MSLGQPMSRFELRTCPKCGAQQQSPGSTICEQCGTDMRVASMQFPSQRSAPRFKVRFLAPTHLLKRTITALVALAVVVVGLSFVPAVSARVPAMKKVAATAKLELRRAEAFVSRFLPGLKIGTQTQRRPSPPAATSQRSAPAKRPVATSQKSVPPRTVAVQPVTVKSTPIGVTVQVNARAVGRTPLTLKLAPGTYKVTFSRSGYATVTRTITVKAGQAASLNVALAKVPAGTPSAPAQMPPPQPQPGEFGK